MPACVSESPAVVIVRIPVTKLNFSCGMLIGPHLSCPMAIALSSRAAGAVRVGLRYTDAAPDYPFIAALKADSLAAGADWVAVG